MIGDRIREARERRDISQRRLAMRLYLHPSTMNLIEHNKVRVTDEKAIPIGKELGITPNELFNWDLYKDL